MLIGQRIRERRLELNMTQEELAKALNYKSKSTINKIELGINDIPLSKVVEFADALHTSVSFLMAWTEDPTQHANGDNDKYDPLKGAKWDKVEDLYHFPKGTLELIHLYNELDPSCQKQVIDYARFLLSQKGNT